MGFLDRLFRRPRPNQVQQAIHKSSMTMAEVSRADLTDGYKKYFVDRNKPSILQPEDTRRRAVASISNRLSIQGLWRENFDRAEIDRLAKNVTFALCEKAVMDYFSTTEWQVVNGENKTIDSATDFLDHPNSQDNFNTLLVATIPDVLRYDAGCIVKSFNMFDQVAELKAYSGPEFLPEVDDEIQRIDGEFGQTVYGIYSHGFVRRWWQHSRPGVFIPFLPAEVVYIKMYPRSDSPFGTSFLSQVKWELEYLTDSTAAAGMTFANGIMPGVVWNHADATGPQQLEEERQAAEALRGPMKFNGVIDTFGDDTITPLTPTMVDMQWLEGQRYVSTIVWALFGFPASEFIEGDANRATAYIGRNITKSRMLAPLLRRYEAYINTQILPDLEGYQPDWRFEFVEAVDRDDELKQVQIDQGKMTISQGYYQMGVALPLALKLAGVDEEMIDAVKAAETAAGPLDADLPTYADTTAGSQTDDGPIVEQYTGTSNDQEHEQSQDGVTE